jgi:DNA polymerase-3 subunit beta
MGDTILIEAKGDDLEIKSGNFKSTLWGLPADEFPSMQKEEPEHLLSFNGQTLTEGINRCIFAASTDSTRVAINSVFFDSLSSLGKFIATDGRRMAISDTHEDNGVLASASIPILAADLIAAAAKDAGSVEVKIGDSTIEAITENTIVTSRLLAEPYPEYQKVLPDETLPWNKASFDRGSLIAAFKRVSLFSDKKLPALVMEFKDGVLALEAHINGQGEAREEVEGNGSDFETCVNPHYIEQMLHSVTGDEIEFWVTDKESPLRIHVEGLVYVVMPMRK